MTILIQVATFVAAIGVLILLGFKIADVVIAIKNIDRNKIREERDAKERAALSKLVEEANKKIAEIDSKSKKK